MHKELSLIKIFKEIEVKNELKFKYLNLQMRKNFLKLKKLSKSKCLKKKLFKD